MSATATNPAASPVSMMNLIINLLTPMFLWSSAGDIPLARAAAIETVNAYRVTNHLTLLTVAKIIAYDLATLSSLSLSMYEDVSILLALKLRGNATSLDRSGDRARRALENARQIPAATHAPTEASVAASLAKAREAVQEAKARTQPEPPPAKPEPAPPAATATPAQQPVPAARTAAPQPPPSAATTPTSAAQRRTAWADAMIVVAAECTAGLDTLPPAERAKELLRIQALSQAATDLASGTPPPPLTTDFAAVGRRT